MPAPYRVIDADGHIAETPAVCDAMSSKLPEQYRALGPHYYANEDGNRHFVLEGKIFPAFKDKDRGQERPHKPDHLWSGREGQHDPHKRMPDMDFMGIDTSVLFCSSMLGVASFVEDAGLAGAISRVYNDWLTDYCRPYADRLKGVAMLPVQDPVKAAKELHRAVEMGMVGTLFPPIYNDKMPDHKDYYPLYEAAQELDIPICIHNNSTIGPARHLLHNFVVRHTFSSVPLMMSLGSVVIGGVLDAFPRLRFAFLEAGAGWLPYILERMQARYELLPHWVGHLKRSPEEYLRGGRLFFSVEPDEATLPMVAQIIGEDSLVMGSDYAHWDGTSPESVRMVMDRDDISDDLKRKILSDNPARLYKM